MSVFGNWTVGKRLLAGFGLSALTLVVISVVSYYNASRLIENDTWVKHTHQVRTDLALLLSQLKDAETGQRGYIITGVDSYLEPYQSAVAAIPATLDNLRRLTADNAGQQRRLSAICARAKSRSDVCDNREMLERHHSSNGKRHARDREAADDGREPNHLAQLA